MENINEMLTKARAEKLWFFCEHYHGQSEIWASPVEIELMIKRFGRKGHRWVLRNPLSQFKSLEEKLSSVKYDHANFKKRLKKSGIL